MDHGTCAVCQKSLAQVMLVYSDKAGMRYCSRVCRDEAEIRRDRPKVTEREIGNMAIETDAAAEVKAETASENKGPEPVANKGPKPVANKGPKKAKDKGPEPVAATKGPKKPKDKGPRPTPNKKAARKAAKRAGKPATAGRKRGKVAPKKAGKGKSAGKPKKTAQKAGKPKKAGPVLKKAPKPVRVHPYRAGSLFAHVFDRLLDGKVHTVIELFADAPKTVADPTRIVGHIMLKGSESGAWRIVREGGKIQMVKVWKKKAA